MTKFAASTSVSVEKSKAEIERTIRRYGADSFVSGWQDAKAMIQFRCAGRVVKFIMTLPDPKDKTFTLSSRGQRSDVVAHGLWEQACRSKWRALTLVIKAKLEAVESGIVEFDREFLAHIVLPEGDTVYERAREGLAIAFKTGGSPNLLTGPRQ